MRSPPPGFLRRPTPDGVVVLRSDLETSLDAIGLFATGGFERLAAAEPLAKGRAETRVLALPARPERAVLRWFRHGGWLGPILGGCFVGSGRARRELIVTARLRAAGAPVPAPLFCVERRRAGPFRELVQATALEPRAVDALVFLASAPAPATLLRACAAAGDAVRRFHDAGGRHPDLHLENLLVRNEADGVAIRIIDLDRARIGAPPSTARRMRELARLARSLTKRGCVAQVGARGIARFFGAYCRDDRALRRALVARFAGARRRLAWHRLGYRLFGP